jgi:chemotaxis-related protein WspB
MLFLLFQLGHDRYALEAGRVVEVLPLVELKGLPQSPPGVAGVFNYRGQPIPAVDLCALTLQRPAQECLSTRILVVRCPGADGQSHLLGLIAEQATEMLRRNRQDFVNAGLKLDSAPYLGPVLLDERGLIQWIHEDRLLPDTVRESLFARKENHP